MNAADLMFFFIYTCTIFNPLRIYHISTMKDESKARSLLKSLLEHLKIKIKIVRLLLFPAHLHVHVYDAHTYLCLGEIVTAVTKIEVTF